MKKPLPRGASSPHRAGDNPISGAQRMGGDFVRNFATPQLDFATVHMWVDLWLYCGDECKLEFLQSWVVGHLKEARDTFNKPVILEEFGKWKPLAVRDRCAASSLCCVPSCVLTSSSSVPLFLAVFPCVSSSRHHASLSEQVYTLFPPIFVHRGNRG